MKQFKNQKSIILSEQTRKQNSRYLTQLHDKQRKKRKTIEYGIYHKNNQLPPKDRYTMNAVSPPAFADYGNAPTFSDTLVEVAGA